MRLFARLLLLVTTVSTAAATTASVAVAAPNADAQPVLVEDYTYPGADKIFTDYGVKLISGDGHILFTECPAGPDNIGLIHVRTADQVGPGKDGKICFKVTASSGHLSMKVPAVFSIRGDGVNPGEGHKLRAEVTTDAGQHTVVDVDPSNYTQVGKGKGDSNAATTLLQLDASSGTSTVAGPVPDGPTGFVAKVETEGRGCSAALVDPEWVLTAASCIPDSSGTPTKPVVVTVGGRVSHAATLIPRADRDVVLAKLDVPVTDVTPVSLAGNGIAGGQTVQIGGYGRTAAEWAPNQQHVAPFTVGDTTGTAVAVASPTGTDMCRGDLGGPAFATANGRSELVAVTATSWQHGCLGETGSQQGGTETRVDDITAWIRQQIPLDTNLNLARAKAVTTSSTYEQDGWSATKAVDGQHDSGWSSSPDKDTENHPEWITVDLGRSQPLSRVDLYPRSDGASTGLGFPVDFAIEVSDDTTNWVPVTSRQGYGRPGADAQEFAISGRSGRYLRVTGSNLSTDPFGHYHMQLAEIEIYRSTLTTGKTVDTSSSYEAMPSWGHTNATDGARSVTGGGSAGWSSLPGPASRSEWLSVDLGTATSVHRVDLLPRGDHLDGSIGYPNAMTIETSTDGQHWTTAASGVGSPSQGQPGRTFEFPPTSAHYIRVTGAGFGPDEHGNYQLQFGEIEAW